MTISLATVLNTHLPANNSSPLNNTSGTAKEGTTFSLHRSYSFVHTHLPDHLLGFLPHTPFKISHPIFNLQYAPIQKPFAKTKSHIHPRTHALRPIPPAPPPPPKPWHSPSTPSSPLTQAPHSSPTAISTVRTYLSNRAVRLSVIGVTSPGKPLRCRNGTSRQR